MDQGSDPDSMVLPEETDLPNRRDCNSFGLRAMTCLVRPPTDLARKQKYRESEMCW
jgi:hypothetical protein